MSLLKFLAWFVPLALIGVPLLLGWFRTATVNGKVRRFVFLLGEDGRRSTSKLTAFTWVVVVAAAAAHLLLSATLTNQTLKSTGLKDLDPVYLLLIGSPLFALIAGKGIVESKANARQLQKPVGTAAVGFGDGGFAADDTGKVDLLDLQYLLFNGVLLAYFVSSVIARTVVPELPPTLVGLTSAAAAAYVAGKAVAANPATISAVTVSPDAPPTAVVSIRGQNLLKPSAADQHVSSVAVDGVKVTGVDWNDQGTVITATTTNAPAAGARVAVTTAAGATVSATIGQ